MCLYATYSGVQIGKHLFEMFPAKKGWKQGALLPSLFNFALQFAIRGVQVNKDDLKLNGTHIDIVNMLGESIHAMKKNTCFSS